MNLIKYWISNFFIQLKHRTFDDGNSSIKSELSDFSNSMHFKMNIEKNTNPEISSRDQDLIKEMNFISLAIIGKEGVGKSALVQAICNDLKLEVKYDFFPFCY